MKDICVVSLLKHSGGKLNGFEGCTLFIIHKISRLFYEHVCII